MGLLSRSSFAVPNSLFACPQFSWFEGNTYTTMDHGQVHDPEEDPSDTDTSASTHEASLRNHHHHHTSLPQHQLLEPMVFLVPLSSPRNEIREDRHAEPHRFDDRIPLLDVPSFDRYSQDSSSSSTGLPMDLRPLTHHSFCSAPTDEEDADRIEVARARNRDTRSAASLWTTTFPQPPHVAFLDPRTTTRSPLSNTTGATAANPIVLHEPEDLLPNAATAAAAVPQQESPLNSSWHRRSPRSAGPIPQNASLASGGTLANPTYPTKPTGHGGTVDEDTTGGRLWKLAGEVAAGKVSLLGHDPRNGPVRQIKETFLERMRSRADPDALCVAIAPPVYSTSPRTTSYISSSQNARPILLVSSSLAHPPSDDELHREDEAFLINTGIAQKRVRVVQLMMIGLFGILLPWMGNLFVSSSCYFASINVVVGGNGDSFPLRFGLWKYTPVSSVLDGSNYCYPYYHSTNDESYSSSMQYPSNAPILSRIFNLAALLAGTFSLVILWYYLISSRVRYPLWKAAVHTALAAGLFQCATPIFFFLGRTCRSHSCAVGPGMALSAVTAVAWWIFAAELYHHCPMRDSNHASAPTNSGTTFEDKVSRRPNNNATTALESYFYDRDRPSTPRFSQVEMSSVASQYSGSGGYDRSYDPPELTFA